MRSTSSPRRLARTALVAAGIGLVTALAAPAAPAQGSPASAASAGCGQAAQQVGAATRQVIGSGGRQREFVLHVPADYDAQRPLPVVLAFHGHGSTGARMDGFSKLSTLPAIVAYPEGLISDGDENRQSWQGAPYSVPDVDDVGFTADLLDHLQSTLCVDVTRVYATGISNGGGFTGLLACRLADRLAAVAAVAGAFYPATGEDCRPARPIPVLELHGTADDTVPYTGGVRDLPAIADWVAGWVGRNGCQVQPSAGRIEPDIAVNSWGGCAGGAEVRHVAVNGGGHTWPGADSYSGGGATTQTIEAHELIWEFASRHQLPSVL
jgi:polyhydroxybutyrate depolymerase